MFNKGDKVVCINDEDVEAYVQEDKTYTVSRYNKGWVLLEGAEQELLSCRFRTLLKSDSVSPASSNDPSFTVKDISNEEWRCYVYKDREYRVDAPAKLYYKENSTGHRVVDKEGVTHWIPLKDLLAIKWKSNPPVSF